MRRGDKPREVFLGVLDKVFPRVCGTPGLSHPGTAPSAPDPAPAPATAPAAGSPAAAVHAALAASPGSAVAWQRASSGDWPAYAADVSRRASQQPVPSRHETPGQP
jgi:hypothetical protein